MPFGDLQNYIAKNCDEDYRTLLFRKYMMDTASFLGFRKKAQALIMGDALAQVSSQTIHNMAALDKECPMLVMRPLVGSNKLDIIRQAQNIGTFETSIIPHDDACALFAPKHPILKADRKYLKEFCGEHDVTQLIRDCVKNAEVYKFDLKGEYVKK